MHKYNADLIDVLSENGYVAEEINGVYFVPLKSGKYQLTMIEKGKTLVIQVSLIRLIHLKDEKSLYKKLLDLNTEILPISIAIDSTRFAYEKLVLNESLETLNLDENELMKVFEVIERNIAKVEKIIEKYIK